MIKASASLIEASAFAILASASKAHVTDRMAPVTLAGAAAGRQSIDHHAAGAFEVHVANGGITYIVSMILFQGFYSQSELAWLTMIFLHRWRTDGADR